jgi:hypothetical protein
MENQQLVSPHDNAPAHQSVLVKDFFNPLALELFFLKFLHTLYLKCE